MKFKKGVNLEGLDIRMRPVLIAAEKIWKKYKQGLVVTARGGLHSAGSLHYYGLALDFRNRDFTPKTKITVAEELQKVLGSSFQVISHSTHIHVEYDS